MRVFLLIIGDELLTGATLEANAGYLAKRLDEMGYRVVRIVVSPDEDEVIREELTRGLGLAEWVLVSGGLGPTHDDRTTQAVAAHFGRDLVIDEAGWARMMERYAKRFGGERPPDEMVEAARKMVVVPQGATPLRNPVGAASGYLVRSQASPDKGVIVFPGVPRELRAIFEEEIVGKVLAPREAPVIEEVNIALGEAEFASELARIASAHPGVSIGSYPHSGELRVTIRIRGEPEAVRAAAAQVRARWGSSVVPSPRAQGA